MNEHDGDGIRARKDVVVAVIALPYLAAATRAAGVAADSAKGVSFMPIEHGSCLADDAALCSAERGHGLAAIAERSDGANTSGFLNAGRKSTFVVVEAEKDELPWCDGHLVVANPSELACGLRSNFELMKEQKPTVRCVL